MQMQNDSEYYYDDDSGSSARIIGGQVAYDHQWPSIVRMRMKSRDPDEDLHYPHCGGTIISSTYILTAAHCCAKDVSFPYPADSDFISFEIGTNIDSACEYSHKCTSNRSHYSSVIISAIKVEIHPRYKTHPRVYHNGIKDVMAYDFCLVQTEEINFAEINKNVSMRVERAVLPLDHIEPFWVTNSEQSTTRECYIAGWGIRRTEKFINGVSSGKTSEVLLTGKTEIMSTSYCNRINAPRGNSKHLYKRIGGNHSFCSGSGDSDTCGDDSGGPLYCKVNGTSIQYGVTSHGPKRCGQNGKPGVFGKVSAIIPWIQNYTDILFPRIIAFGEWSQWSDCSKTCGSGLRNRQRSCQNGNIGDPGCSGKATESMACYLPECGKICFLPFITLFI